MANSNAEELLLNLYVYSEISLFSLLLFLELSTSQISLIVSSYSTWKLENYSNLDKCSQVMAQVCGSSAGAYGMINNRAN